MKETSLLTDIRTLFEIIGAIGTVGSCMIAGLALGWAYYSPQTVTAIVQVITSNTPNPTVVIVTPPPTAPPVPEMTETPTPILPTPTLPSPTDTPLIVIPQAPPGTILFEDNFDVGVKSDWQLSAGMWRMVDSEYAADPSKTWSKTYIGDENWVSYSVEFEASYGRGYGYDQDIALIVRAQGEKEMWIIMDCDDTDFYLNGSSDPIAHKDAGLRPCDSSKKKVKVEVQGNIYKVYVDGSSIFTVQDSTLERGRVGLAVKNSHERTPRFDNFKIIALE